MHITLVEDDPMNAKVMERVLTRLGNYEVTVTEDVDTILELARSDNTDLVILDVSLTNSRLNGTLVDGVTISRMLKTGPPACTIPILLATAHAMRGDAQRLLDESLADGYISKPIPEPHLLTDKVRALLESAKATAQPVIETTTATG